MIPDVLKNDVGKIGPNFFIIIGVLTNGTKFLISSTFANSRQIQQVVYDKKLFEPKENWVQAFYATLQCHKNVSNPFSEHFFFSKGTEVGHWPENG